MSGKDPSIDINYVSSLARLNLSEKDKEKISLELDDILSFFKKLDSVNVDGIEPMSHAHKVQNIWREGDEAGELLNKEVLNKLAPETRDDQVVVPKVVD